MAITSVRINHYVRPYQEALVNLQSAPSNYYGFQPLKSGNKAPYFNHPVSQTLFPATNRRRTDAANRLNFNKPVVLVFRPVFHNDADIQRLFLESLQADVSVMGGELLVVTNATVKSLTANLQRTNTLHIFSDPDNEIARNYGLYNAANPLSDWLSGVEGDISLPAYYILSPGGRIVYHYVDYNFRTYNYEQFDGQQFVRQLLTAVYQSAQRLKETEHNNFPRTEQQVSEVPFVQKDRRDSGKCKNSASEKLN